MKTYNKYFYIQGVPKKTTFAQVKTDLWDKGTRYEEYRVTLDKLWVAERHEGKGYGKQLIDQVIKWAKRNRIKEIWFSNMNKPFWKHIKKRRYYNLELKRWVGVLHI